jgi:hypothetical protein
MEGKWHGELAASCSWHKLWNYMWPREKKANGNKKDDLKAQIHSISSFSLLTEMIQSSFKLVQYICSDYSSDMVSLDILYAVKILSWSTYKISLIFYLQENSRSYLCGGFLSRLRMAARVQHGRAVCLTVQRQFWRDVIKLRASSKWLCTSFHAETWALFIYVSTGESDEDVLKGSHVWLACLTWNLEDQSLPYDEVYTIYS